MEKWLYSEEKGNGILTLQKVKRNGKYLFSKENSEPYRGDFKKGFSAAVRRSEIPHIRFHDLRHTFATRLAANGANLVYIQKLSRHKTLEMSVRYAHTSPDMERIYVDMLREDVGITYCK